MAKITHVHVYLDDAENFPTIVPFADFDGHIGISASDGSTIIPEVKTADLLTVRFVNFAPSPLNPTAKFGSILGVAYVYDDGAKSWIKSVKHKNSNSVNVDVAIGNWVEGLTYDQAKANTRYKKPYIGYASSTDYIEFYMEEYTAPPVDPPVDPPVEPKKITVNILEDTVSIKKGESVILNSLILSQADITSYKWTAPEGVTVSSQSETSAMLQINQVGTYTIKLEATNSDKQSASDTATIIVRDLHSISVNIIEDSQTVIKGQTLDLHATVESSGRIIAQKWVMPFNVDVKAESLTEATVTFNKIGTFLISYGAINEDQSEALDQIIITVVEPQKKLIEQSLYLDINGDLIEVDPSVTLNNYAVNVNNLVLKFLNNGESKWVSESFSVEVGKESFKFSDGTTSHKASAVREPNASYTLNGLIQGFKDSTKYTIVIQATVIDDQGLTLTRFYELKWYVQEKESKPLQAYNLADPVHKIPSIMKRNARYRGHRESEKVLSDHQEQIYDIRVQHVDGETLTELQNKQLKAWYQGENVATAENITIDQAKSFTTYKDQTVYPLNPGTPESQYSNLMVEFNREDITYNSYIYDGYLHFAGPLQDNGLLTVSYTVTLSKADQSMPGTQKIQAKLRSMDERLGELERRYQRYENTYE